MIKRALFGLSLLFLAGCGVGLTQADLDMAVEAALADATSTTDNTTSTALATTTTSPTTTTTTRVWLAGNVEFSFEGCTWEGSRLFNHGSLTNHNRVAVSVTLRNRFLDKDQNELEAISETFEVPAGKSVEWRVGFADRRVEWCDAFRMSVKEAGASVGGAPTTTTAGPRTSTTPPNSPTSTEPTLPSTTSSTAATTSTTAPPTTSTTVPALPRWVFANVKVHRVYECLYYVSARLTYNGSQSVSSVYFSSQVFNNGVAMTNPATGSDISGFLPGQTKLVSTSDTLAIGCSPTGQPDIPWSHVDIKVTFEH